MDSQPDWGINMTTEMFGAPVGMEAAQSFMLRQAQIPLVQAQARLTGAEAGLKQSQLDMQKKFMDGMAQLKQSAAPGPMGMASNIDNMANIAMQSGQVDRAADLSDKAALLRMRMASMAHNQMLAQNMQLQQGQRTTGMLGQLLQGATDQASWDRGNALFSMMTGQRSPYAGVPFSPELPKQIQEQAMTAAQSSARAIQAKNEASLEQSRQSAEDFRQSRLAIMQQMETDRQAREARLAKVGGKTVGSPNKLSMQQATALITSKLPDLPADEADAAAYTLAARAEALVQQNPGLDRATAMAQAYAEPQFNSHLKTIDKYGAFSRMTGIGSGSISFDRTAGEGPWTQYGGGDQEDAE